MTCPSLLRRTAVDGVRQGRLDGCIEPTWVRERSSAVRERSSAARERLQQDDARAQFVRFVVVGGVSSALYAVVFISLQGFGAQVANLSGAIASTLLANEMHRRSTFHAGGRVSWFTAQWEGGGLAGIGLVATSLALAGLHTVTGDVGAVGQLGLIAAVTGAIGLIRFVALRSWVFSPAARD
ncbi:MULTISPECIES: GtrA family protein [unclassified Modestobacter]|uniref:GtrA family protein n=1 Tax=unclassified Modestobacter TaxID=2643866 RepID=UPI0022AB4CA5|nr:MULTISPECIES: GtrA family protein [unclassified Modestobacter]MCZ2823455.1 GtrA family protein [Modestobacter sp. VKM Ac-2981]MCZ2851700.1 GtrA family protein [Modestobacter sp. VKM Ac-2982]